MKVQEKTIIFKINPELGRAFKAKLASEGLSLRKWGERMITRYTGFKSSKPK